MSNPTTSEQDVIEWTDDYVEEVFGRLGGAKDLADAHNAALAAERERYRKLLDAERRRCFDLEQQLAAIQELIDAYNASEDERPAIAVLGDIDAALAKKGGIGINCGGMVFVKSLRKWHELATKHIIPKPNPTTGDTGFAAPLDQIIEKDKGNLQSTTTGEQELREKIKDFCEKNGLREHFIEQDLFRFISAALAAEQEKTKQAWQEHDDVASALAGFSETIKQLGARNQQLREQLDAAKSWFTDELVRMKLANELGGPKEASVRAALAKIGGK